MSRTTVLFCWIAWSVLGTLCQAAVAQQSGISPAHQVQSVETNGAVAGCVDYQTWAGERIENFDCPEILLFPETKDVVKWLEAVKRSLRDDSPGPKDREPYRIVHPDHPRRLGRFVFDSVPPGDYLIVALATVTESFMAAGPTVVHDPRTVVLGPEGIIKHERRTSPPRRFALYSHTSVVPEDTSNVYVFNSQISPSHRVRKTSGPAKVAGSRWEGIIWRSDGTWHLEVRFGKDGDAKTRVHEESLVGTYRQLGDSVYVDCGRHKFKGSMRSHYMAGRETSGTTYGSGAYWEIEKK